jgi:hypothetical protein
MARGEFAGLTASLATRRLDPQYERACMVNLRIVQERLDDAGAELAGMRDIAPESAGCASRPSSRWCAATRTAMAHYQHAASCARLSELARRRGTECRPRPTPTRSRVCTALRRARSYILGSCDAQRTPERGVRVTEHRSARDPNVMMLLTDPSLSACTATCAAIAAQIVPRTEE